MTKRICTHLSCGALGAVLLTLTACCSTQPRSTAIELFDGKSLKGWDYVLADPQVKMEQVWSVQDGVLTCQGTPIGAIFKGPEVTNFRLVVEYRWPAGQKPGNSGIFSRISRPATALPKAVEVQLKHGDACDVMGLKGRTVAGGQPRFFSIANHPVAGDIAGVKKLADLERPAGEWNLVEIVAQGGHYTVHMNGQLINEVDGVEVLAGPVGLQSEGGVVQFRRATLTPLD